MEHVEKHAATVHRLIQSAMVHVRAILHLQQTSQQRPRLNFNVLVSFPLHNPHRRRLVLVAAVNILATIRVRVDVEVLTLACVAGTEVGPTEFVKPLFKRKWFWYAQKNGC